MELFQPFLGHFLPLFQVLAAAKILFFFKTPLLKQKYFLKKRSILHFSSWHIDLFLIYQALLSPLRNLLDYGKKVLKALSEKLCLKYGEGWSYSNLRQIRQFYLAYANLTDGVCQIQFDLSWSHYLILMRIENHGERNFYEIEARFCLFGV